MTTLDQDFAVPHVRVRMLAAPGPDLAAHLGAHGPLPSLHAEEVLGAAEREHLRGRGGAGFPTATKLRAVASNSTLGRPLVIGNGSEGEPASLKDRALLRSAPHLVIDGAQAAAVAVGAREIVLYLHAAAVDGVRRALAERERAGRTAGAAPASVRVVAAAPGFVAGQETAVVAALAGDRAVPRGGTERVVRRGLDGRPTLVQNVETLAQLALLVRAAHTTDPSRRVAGTRLTTVYAPSGRGVVHEVDPETRLERLLEQVGWPPGTAGPVLVGGYHGRWLPSAAGVTLATEDLARQGARPGAGVIIPIGAQCGLGLTASIVRYLAEQSAGQCGPCRFGLPHLADLTERLARPTAAGSAGLDLVGAIAQAAGIVTGRGACRHPDGTAGLVSSTLSTFAADVEAHRHGHCLVARREVA
ncbi:NADH-ubiquinone oxidoreductase-F iron-sulfur binding region domain-containing protein [Spongisporangium articulatum]|uniref:NADH-ubiquinone oxidoreductase-F iron-sulfur binding region domain-containing protein n=1 Tax=Spongisporangium articulatum TaxID=3362603 RepID=A0ABW8AJG4_9ACTN